jgi:hypothetical protein
VRGGRRGVYLGLGMGRLGGRLIDLGYGRFRRDGCFVHIGLVSEEYLRGVSCNYIGIPISLSVFLLKSCRD